MRMTGAFSPLLSNSELGFQLLVAKSIPTTSSIDTSICGPPGEASEGLPKLSHSALGLASSTAGASQLTAAAT